MMRVEELVHELKEKITHLETELAEVKEKVAALPKRVGGVFKPEDRERYWYISQAGEADTSWWDNYHVDHDRYAIGNCFPTKQSAEDTVRVLKLIQKARVSQDGFVPDWEDSTQDKYLMYSDGSRISTTGFSSTNTSPILGFWKNKSACDQFIKDNHDELLWFFTEYRR